MDLPPEAAKIAALYWGDAFGHAPGRMKIVSDQKSALQRMESDDYFNGNAVSQFFNTVYL